MGGRPSVGHSLIETNMEKITLWAPAIICVGLGVAFYPEFVCCLFFAFGTFFVITNLIEKTSTTNKSNDYQKEIRAKVKEILTPENEEKIISLMDQCAARIKSGANIDDSVGRMYKELDEIKNEKVKKAIKKKT